MPEVVTANKDGVTIALRSFALNLKQRNELLGVIGKGQLLSIYRTFDEGGSPAGSWVPLSPNTIRRNPKKYGPGHKLLIDHGILRNSFSVQVTSTGVIIGTNVKYAPVHQFGSADRTGGPFSPQAKLADRAVSVDRYSYVREREIHYQRVEVTRADGTKVMVPRAMRTGKAVVVGKDGRQRTVNKLFEGPRQQVGVNVSSHSRHQNIPARPYAVLRPEDPARIEKQVHDWIERQKAKSRLAASNG